MRRPPRPWRRPPTPPISFRMWREKFVATRYVIRLRIHEQPRNKGWVMSQDYVCSIPSQGRQLKRWGRQLKTCSRNARAIQHERHALHGQCKVFCARSGDKEGHFSELFGIVMLPGREVKLIHVQTDRALHSHRERYKFFPKQQVQLSAGKSVLSQWPCRKCTRFGEGCCSEQPHTKLFHPLEGNTAC